MIEYLAFQIIEGKLTYQKVMTKFSANKAEIDAILIREGRGDLIEEIEGAEGL